MKLAIGRSFVNTQIVLGVSPFFKVHPEFGWRFILWPLILWLPWDRGSFQSTSEPPVFALEAWNGTRLRGR